MMSKLGIFLILGWLTLACQAPVEPEVKSSSLQTVGGKKTIAIQLWVGRIKYAAYVGGGEWRATFEVKIMADSVENIRDQCEITFFWKAKSTKPAATESGWISHPGIFKHGLMSIDGMWLDRLPLTPLPQPYWMRAQVTSDKFGSIDVIGLCNFLESVERFQIIAQTMQRNRTILIAGEAGTGKTLLAKFICQHSPWYNPKTRTVRLDEIPDALLEKELFGYNGFEGRIKAADEGTLILKDVAHLPWHLQAKFLRLLEENEFERFGEADIIKVNLRTVFVTSENLFQTALENKFRQDLYYKLAATEITLPPLRNRKEDIEPLCLYYLNCTALQQRKNLERIAQEALNALQNYDWPGNVRELKAEIELAVAKAAPEKQVLELDDLSANVRFKLPQPHAPSYHFAKKIKLIERQMIIAAIENNHGNKARAAKSLGINQRTLYEKMKTLDIPLGNHKPPT